MHNELYENNALYIKGNMYRFYILCGVSCLVNWWSAATLATYTLLGVTYTDVYIYIYGLNYYANQHHSTICLWVNPDRRIHIAIMTKCILFVTK